MLWALADPALNARAGRGRHARDALAAPGPGLPRAPPPGRREDRGIEDKVTYAITSLPPARADAAALLTLLRDHWGIENRLHYVRDVTFDEDRSAVRTKAAPQVAAACRNLVIALLRRAGATNIAAACRTCAGRPRSAIALIASAGVR